MTPPSTTTLTRRQRDVLDFIREHVDEHGYPPSVREITTAVGLRSVASTHHVINTLVNLGALERAEGQPRALRVVTEPSEAGLRAAEAVEDIRAAADRSRAGTLYTPQVRDALCGAVGVVAAAGDARAVTRAAKSLRDLCESLPPALAHEPAMLLEVLRTARSVTPG